MKQLQINYKRQYRKRETGTLVFVYNVTGPKDLMEAYKKSKGEKLVIDDKTDEVLYFTTTYVQKRGTLLQTSQGEFTADTSEMDQFASLAQKYKSAEIAAHLMGRPGTSFAGNNSSPDPDEEEETPAPDHREAVRGKRR